jgi:hypothetical protein
MPQGFIPLSTQMDFLWNEVQGKELPGFGKFLTANASTPEDYATLWDKYYERSGGAGDEKARGYANSVYAAMHDGTSNPGVISPNAKFAYGYLTQKGLTPQQAAGVTGRLMAESYQDMNPDARNTLAGGKGTYGIAQWRGSRMEDLANFAGVDVADITSLPATTASGGLLTSNQGGQDMAISNKPPYMMGGEQTYNAPNMRRPAPQQGGMRGLLSTVKDKAMAVDPNTGLTGYQRFARALDPLIMPELRGAGEAIEKQGAQRVAAEKRNKTADYLEKISPDAAALLREGFLSPSEALKISSDSRMQAMAKSAGDAFRAGNMQEAMAILTEMSPTAMGQQIAAQAMKPPSEVMGGGKYTVTYPEGRSGEPVITVNEDVVAAEQRIRQAELEQQRTAAGLPSDARKAEEADFEAISSLDNIIQDIGGIVDDFGYNAETGEFTGPLNIGLGGFIEGAFGSIGVGGKGAVETAKAREEFDRFKTRLIAESLRLNAGVQTDGDAKRAAAELGDAKSKATAYAAIQELLKINQRARSAREAAIIRRRERFKVSGVDVPAPAASPDLGWRIK